MANIPIDEAPNLNLDMENFTDKTPVHFDEMNGRHKQHLNNEKALLYPTFDDSGTAAGISSFNDFLATVKNRMRLFDFFKNFKTGMQFVMHLGKSANNCTTTATGLYLDARQGKVLMDLYTKLNSDLSVVGSNASVVKNLNTAVEYLSGFSSIDVETDCLKPVESGIYVKKTGIYLIIIRFAFTGCENNQLTYGHRNFLNADNYVDSYDIDYCSHNQSFNRTQIRIGKVETGRYIRPIVGGSVNVGRCTAANITVLSVKSN